MRRLGEAALAAGLLVLLTGCGSQATAPDYTPSVTVAPTSAAPTSAASPSATPPASTAPSATPSASAAEPVAEEPAALDGRCADEALGVSVVPAADGGGAGSRSYDVLVTNVGGETCALRGAPRVAVVEGPGGSRIGPAADRLQDGAATVELAAGASAVAVLQVVDIDPDGGPLDGCTVRRGAGWRVVPPGAERAEFAADATAVACADGPAFMTVGPLLAQ